MSTTISARTAIRTHVPSQPHELGHGTSRTWTRRINGKKFCFTAITMPSGELRWSVGRFDGADDEPNFGHLWTRTHFIVVKPGAPAPVTQPEPVQDEVEDEPEAPLDPLAVVQVHLLQQLEINRQLTARIEALEAAAQAPVEAAQPSAPEPMPLTVVNGMDGVMHVHLRGCVDVGRIRANGSFDLEATSKTGALTEIWTDFLDEWDGDLSTGEDATRFYSCTDTLAARS